jgi:hypothetical protein
VEETNHYYKQYLGFLDNGPFPVPEVTETEMFLFPSIIKQMGHSIHENLKDYWSTTEELFSPFYGKTTRYDRFLHHLRFLHFSNNDKAFDSNDLN